MSVVSLPYKTALPKIISYAMHRQRRRRARSYFQITEDPPQVLPSLRKTQRALKGLHLPSSNFFFIDFTEECQLRLMKKMSSEQFGSTEPLEMERFGKNVIINVEDSSPLENQLVKYEEQHRSIMEKKSTIEAKVKESLEKSKNKIRSKSVLTIRQELIEQYRTPLKMKKRQSIEPLAPLQHSSPKLSEALRKLGLTHE